MDRIRTIAVLCLCVILLLGSVTVTAETSGEPSFVVYLPENIVEPGEETDLTFEVRNDAVLDDTDGAPGSTSTVTEARNVSLSVNEADAPVSVKTNETPVIDMSDGTLLSESFTVAIDEEAEAGTHELEVEISYTYTPSVDSDGDEADEVDETVTETVEIVVEERAQFDADAVDSDVVVGDTGTATLSVENVGVENASDARVVVGATDPDLEIPTDGSQTYVGSWDVDEVETIDVPVTVTEDALARSYPLSVVVEFRDDDGIDRTSREIPVGVAVEDDTRFSAETIDADLLVGESGTLTLDVENVGAREATESTVRFESADPEVDIDAQASEQFVGTWKSGSNVTLETALDISDDAVAGSYPVSVVVDYRDHNGVERTSRPIRVGAPVAEEQRFTLDGVESELHVGEDGSVTGEVVNDGPRPVENLVLLVDDGDDTLVPDIGDGVTLGQTITPRESQVAIGSLDVNESAAFSLPLGVSQDAEPGARVLEVEPRYRSPDGDRLQTDPIDAVIEVQPARDEFAVEPVDATYEAGSEGRIVMNLTNQYGQTVTDLEAKIFANDPLDTDDDEAFVSELEPGETTAVSFDLSVDDGAAAETYPLRMDFRYDDDDGNAQLSDTYRIAITVTEADDSGLTALGLLVGLVTVGVAAAIGWRYRGHVRPYVDDRILAWLARISARAEPLRRRLGTFRGGSSGSSEPDGHDGPAEDGATAFEYEETILQEGREPREGESLFDERDAEERSPTGDDQQEHSLIDQQDGENDPEH